MNRKALFLLAAAAAAAAALALPLLLSWSGPAQAQPAELEGVKLEPTVQVGGTALQLNGARGYAEDTVLEWIYRYARQARLVDGASEVHKMVLARTLLDEGLDFWAWR